MLSIVFLMYLIYHRKYNAISLVISTLIVFSSITSIIIHRTPVLLNNKDYLIQAYTIILLLIFTHAFNKHKNIYKITNNYNKLKFRVFLNFIKPLGFIILIVNCYIVYKAIGLIFTDAINIDSYKNQEGATEFLTLWINPKLLTLSHIISPFGYFSIGLHFYYLSKNNIKESLIHLLLSLNIPLHGLHGLSRSSSILYILLYATFFIYTLPSIDPNYRRKIKLIITLTISILLLPLIIITSNRFSDSYFVENKSKLKNTAIFSVLDYASQWNQNGIEVLGSYSSDKSMYGSSSTTALTMIINKIGFKKKNYVHIRDKSMGKYSSWFTGLVATLVYDFGFYLAFIFALIYYYFTRKIAPKNGVVSITQFIWFGLLVPIPLMFFGNNQLSNIIYNIAILYAIIFSLLMKINLKNQTNFSN